MKKFITIVLSVSMLITGMSTASASNNIIIGPKYEKIESFSEGLSAIRVDSQWGYIAKSGNIVIRPKYYRASSFSEGKAIVAVGDYRSESLEIGFIDKSGKFTNFRDSSGKEFTKSQSDMYSEEDFRLFEFHNGLAYLYSYSDGDLEDSRIFDTNGREVDYNGSSENVFFVGNYNEDMIPAIDTDKDKMIYTNRDGENSISFKSYSDMSSSDRTKRIVDIRSFNQGLAPVVEAYNVSGNTIAKWGFVDKSGNMVISPRYSDFYTQDIGGVNEIFSDGIAAVQDASTGLWGAINKSGKTVVDFKYKKLYAFKEGLAACKLPGQKYFGFIDKSGKTVIPSYDISQKGNRLSLVTMFEDGVAIGYDAVEDKTFAIKQNPNSDGTFEIANTSEISKDMYFENGEDGVIYTPEKYMIIKRDNRYGIVENDFEIGLPPKKLMDDWAYSEVLNSINKDLVPKSLQNQYREDISREDFSTLIINTMEEMTGKSIEGMVKETTGQTLDYFVSRYPFTDSSNREIIAANALGIIKGTGNDKFKPYDHIIRQDAATLLMRVGKHLGENTSSRENNFKDRKDISSYAVEGVDFVSSKNIMFGTGDNSFSPKSRYTRQQAYITMDRLLKNIG